VADRAHRAGALTYDPDADLATRYPHWVVRRADLDGLVPEVLCWVRRVILIETSSSPEVDRSSLAHAVAHLDLGHTRTVSGFFENREEGQADRLAARRLIRVDDFAQALAWSQDRGEIASQLGVDVSMLQVREATLSATERSQLRRVDRAMGRPA